ncbi:hypothetical protein COCOBI_01-2010 [Coccomyxa sp. Obi]|nr:hypothetical protein COCOBI_01-2010 [Coccomyxa sp. Obi]
MSDFTAPTSHALQWRTPSPVPKQRSSERKHSEGEPAEAPHVQQRHSLDAAWTERNSSDLAEQHELHEDHVHWAHVQRSSQKHHPYGSQAGSYQPFSLKDYRDNDYDPKQRSYWTLGTLGKDPDTAEVQRKKENAEKVRDLSQAIREQNLAARASSPARQPRPSPQQEPKKPSTRERAFEYARNLTRAASPKKRRSRGDGYRVRHMGSIAEGVPAPAGRPSMALLMDIEQLEALHGQQQKQVEQIYKEFGRGPTH